MAQQVAEADQADHLDITHRSSREPRHLPSPRPVGTGEGGVPPRPVAVAGGYDNRRRSRKGRRRWLDRPRGRGQTPAVSLGREQPCSTEHRTRSPSWCGPAASIAASIPIPTSSSWRWSASSAATGSISGTRARCPGPAISLPPKSGASPSSWCATATAASGCFSTAARIAGPGSATSASATPSG